MNTPKGDSGNSSILNPLQKTTLGLTAVGTAGYGLYDPSGLGEVATSVATSTNNILSSVGDIINDTVSGGLEVLGSNVPFAGVAAPFAAPMIAGGYLGKRLADISGVEKRWLKVAASAVGAGLGAGVSFTAAAPYLTGVAAATALYKPFKWGMGKIGKGLSSVYGGVTGFVGGAVRGAVKGGLNGAKHNWNDGKVVPDMGFRQTRQGS